MQESRGEEGEKWGLEGRGTDEGKEDLLALKAPLQPHRGSQPAFSHHFPPFPVIMCVLGSYIGALNFKC